MKYRDAKLLKEGNVVTSKETGNSYFVSSIEVYGNIKRVRINCFNTPLPDISFLNDEVDSIWIKK
jgi:hypothetical protein